MGGNKLYLTIRGKNNLQSFKLSDDAPVLVPCTNETDSMNESYAGRLKISSNDIRNIVSESLLMIMNSMKK